MMDTDVDIQWLQSTLDAEVRRNEELQQRLRIAEAVRDDARAASQRYLDEKRETERLLGTCPACGARVP